jgi:hypothetical protein
MFSLNLRRYELFEMTNTLEKRTRDLFVPEKVSYVIYFTLV